MDPTIVLLEEVALEIFIRLRVEDILTCCLVSHSWREAVNNDIVWKRLSKNINNLQSVWPVVEPQFQLPPHEHLTTICGNRLKYMQEIHLRNNFIKNKCVDYQLCTNSFVAEAQFLDNYQYLLLMEEGYPNYLKVWNVVKTPVFVQTVQLLLEDAAHTFLSLGDRLLILQGKLMQIYTIVDGLLSLKLCRIFDRDEDFSLSNIPREDIKSWYNSIFERNSYFFRCRVSVLGKYFIGVVQPLRSNSSFCFNSSLMHIWDLNSGMKVRAENLPQISEIIVNISFTKYSKFLYMCMYLVPSSISKCKIYSYDLNELQYTQFYTASNCLVYSIVCQKRFTVLINNDKYVLVDSVTGQTIEEKCSGYPTYLSSVNVYNSVIALGSNRTVTIIDICTPNESEVLQVNFVVANVILLDRSLLLVAGFKDNHFFEVWDIKKKSKLYRIEKSYMLAYSRDFLRLCVKRNNNNVNVLNYW